MNNYGVITIYIYDDVYKCWPYRWRKDKSSSYNDALYHYIIIYIIIVIIIIIITIIIIIITVCYMENCLYGWYTYCKTNKIHYWYRF